MIEELWPYRAWGLWFLWNPSNLINSHCHVSCDLQGCTISGCDLQFCNVWKHFTLLQCMSLCKSCGAYHISRSDCKSYGAYYTSRSHYMEVHVGFSTVEQTLEYLMHFLHNGLESSYSYVDLILHLGTRTILVWILILVIFMPVGIHRE